MPDDLVEPVEMDRELRGTFHEVVLQVRLVDSSGLEDALEVTEEEKRVLGVL